MSDERDDSPLTAYTEQSFNIRSNVFAVVVFALIFWLCDANGWQVWVLAVSGAVIFSGVSMTQTTLIEGSWIVVIVTVLVAVLARTDFFDFHWSVILATAAGVMHGAGGRESRMRHQYRMAYGDEAYLERYRRATSGDSPGE